ncbi:MAG: hypothetical protein ACI8RY_001621 [Urechidicola sp.]|jgi:hypothetical protein|tara:strand:- start:479 stop:595 length:117 start_codon:yes stop_codon:yes gene_type:complete
MLASEIRLEKHTLPQFGKMVSINKESFLKIEDYIKISI